jgi:hypothetical protein
MRGLLALISPLDPVANARVDVTVGVSLNSRTLNLGGLAWQTAIIKAPRLTQELVDEDITGSIQLGSGDMTLTANRLKGLANVTKLIWPGSPITIWSGSGPQLADMRLEFSGTVTGGVRNKDNGQIPLTFSVDKKLVDVPMLNQEYGGGGGADGETEVRGQLKPAAFGSPINVPVFFFNQTLWIGQVDAYGNTTALDLLYEDGASFGPKFANYASYALLYAAANAGTIPAGAWATCVAEGMVALGAPPKGVITADPVCGAGTPGTLGLRWLTAHAGVSSGRIDEAALLGHVPPVSYWTQSQVNVLERLQMLASSCNATMLLRLDGQLAISRVFGGAVELSLSRHGGHPRVTAWQTLDPTTPWWRLKISAERTWRVHSEQEIDYENDIIDLGDYDDTLEYRQGNVVRGTDGFRYLYTNAAATTGNDPPNVTYWSVYEDPVDASTVKYADGTPVEALKPGEAGANVTGTHQAASIAAQGALATLNGVNLGTNVFRSTGGPALVNADVITNLGTAASIASQGALATLNKATLGTGGTLVRQDGTTAVTDATAITALGTAAAIASQGALATLSGVNLGTNVYRSTGGAALVDADLITALGTAASIASQGALATLSQVALGASGRVYRDDGTTRLTDLLAVTALGTAAAIAAQGALATLSQVALGASGRVYRDDAVTRLTDALAVTALGTAAAIASQGALATLSSIGASLFTGTVGGGNQVRNSSFETDVDGDGITAGFAPYTNDANVVTMSQVTGRLAGFAQRCAWAANTSTKGLYLANIDGITNENLWKTGGFYVWSWYAKASGAAVGNTLQTFWNHPPDTVTYLVNPALTANWQRYVVLLKWNTGSLLDGNGFISITSATANGVSTLDFDDMQIEEGDVLTAYAPRTDEILPRTVTYGLLSTTAGRLGINIVRNDGSTSFTDSIGVTSLGTAAAIASQGALATLSQVALGASGRVYRDDAVTRLTDALAVTALGTAAAIAAQGALATLSQVALGASGRVYRDDGTTRLTDALAVTALGTAAAIVSQGAFATLSAISSGLADTNNLMRRTSGGLFTGDLGATLMDNFAINGYFAAGQTGIYLGPDAAYVTLGAANDPAPHGIRFVANPAGGNDASSYAYINNAAQSPYPHRKMWIAFALKCAVASGVYWYANCYDAAANLLGVVSTPTSATAGSGAWEMFTSEMPALPLGTALVQVYVQRNGARTSAMTVTAFRVAPSALGATVGSIFNSNTYRNDGVTLVTDSLAITALGTAAAFASQGALATLNWVGFGAAGLVYKQDGSTHVTDALAITSLGTAAAIASQGSGATANNLTALNATEGAKLTGIATGAGTVGFLQTLGTYSFVVANQVYKNGGTHGAFEGGAVGIAQTGGVFIQSSINYPVVGGGWETHLALDNDATSYAVASMNYRMAIHTTGGGAANYDWTLYVNNSSVASGSGSGLTLYSTFAIAYDNAYVYGFVDGAVVGTTALQTPGQKLWPKLLDYYGNGPTAPIQDIQHGPFRDIARSSLFGTNGVALNSNMLPANVLYGLIPSLKTAPTISDTDNSGTVTLNIGSAVHIPDSGGTVTFPSGTLSGKAYGTTYYIKRVGVDPVTTPTGTGWNASTTLTISVGDVYENYYVTRATGGTPSPPPPPPPGGGGQCVAVDMWIELDGAAFRQAEIAERGWSIITLDYGTLASSSVGAIDTVEFSYEQCVRLVTESGGAGVFSETTPLTRQDGSSLNIMDGEDEYIFVRDRRGGSLVERWERIAQVQPAGRRQVAHIHAGGATFAAGESEDFMLMTHNYDKP